MLEAREPFPPQGGDGISIVIPVKVPDLRYLDGLAECYRALLRAPELSGRLQVIIVDDSPDHVYAAVDRWFPSEAGVHFPLRGVLHYRTQQQR